MIDIEEQWKTAPDQNQLNSTIPDNSIFNKMNETTTFIRSQFQVFQFTTFSDTLALESLSTELQTNSNLSKCISAGNFIAPYIFLINFSNFNSKAFHRFLVISSFVWIIEG